MHLKCHKKTHFNKRRYEDLRVQHCIETNSNPRSAHWLYAVLNQILLCMSNLCVKGTRIFFSLQTDKGRHTQVLVKTKLAGHI